MDTDTEPIQHPMVYVEGERTIYRASQLYSCPRNFIYARTHQPTSIPPQMQAAFNYGTSHEQSVIDKLTARGYEIINQQQAVWLPISDQIQVVGHIDGMIWKQHNKPLQVPRLLEVKCLSHANTELFLDDYERHFPYYAWQSSAYIYSLKMIGPVAILFAIYDKDEDNLHEVLRTQPAISLQTIKDAVLAREKEWETYRNTDSLPSCLPNLSFCPYYQLHEETRDDLPLINDPSLEALLVSLSALQSKESSIHALTERVKAQLKTYLTDHALTSGQTGKYKFKLTTINSRVIDTKRVRAYLKEQSLESEYTRDQSSQRLSVEKIERVESGDGV